MRRECLARVFCHVLTWNLNIKVKIDMKFYITSYFLKQLLRGYYILFFKKLLRSLTFNFFLKPLIPKFFFFGFINSNFREHKKLK